MTQAKTVTITAPRELSGATIKLPLSKSISNRALAICAFGEVDWPWPIALCDDTMAMSEGIADTGKPVIDIGAAGTAMRFLTAFLAIEPGQHILTGSPRMLQRPIGPLVEALRQLGADITYKDKEGFPPLVINGQQLQGGTAEIDGGVSSQFVSALLMLGPMLPKGIELHLRGEIKSRPYINMTLQLMRHYGALAKWTSQNCITVKHRHYRETKLKIEADWSAAQYWYEAVAFAPVGSSVSLYGLDKQSIQGDSRVARLFERLSVETEFRSGGEPSVLIRKTAEADKELFEANLSDCPDLAQSLIVTCAMLDVPFRFSGLDSLAIKETDRGAALKTELQKMGIAITVDGGIISMSAQNSKPHAAAIATYDDHRMAMAFAPTAIVTGTIAVENPGVTSKSYPKFWDDLKTAGFDLSFQ